MNVVVLAVSQKWQDEELVRGTLRKLHDLNPDATLRVAARPSGAAKAARDFADALGFEIEEYAPGNWFKYPSEIRNQEMLDGMIRKPEYPLLVLDRKPRADLLMAFWCGTSDNVKDLIDRRLFGGDSLVVYREKWEKKKGKEPKYKGLERAVNLKRLRSKLAPWEPVEQKERAAA